MCVSGTFLCAFNNYCVSKSDTLFSKRTYSFYSFVMLRTIFLSWTCVSCHEKKCHEKNFFFQFFSIFQNNCIIALILKLGLPAKPDCRGNRLNSEIFFFGFFLKIKSSTSLYRKQTKLYRLVEKFLRARFAKI